MGGTELLIAGAVLQVVQGVQQYNAAKAQAQAYEQQGVAQRQMAEYNAALEKNRATVEKQQVSKQQRKVAASARVRGAGSGASLDSFSDVDQMTYENSMTDLALLDYDSRLAQDQALYQGQIGQWEANNNAAQARSQGKSALISGIAGAGMTVAGGMSNSNGYSGRTPVGDYYKGSRINWN